MTELRSRRNTILIVLAVVVVVLGAGAIVLKTMFTPERIRAEVVRAVHGATGLSMELAVARLSLIPLAIDLEGVLIEGVAAEDPPLLTLDSARMRVALAGLLRGRIIVETLRFERPVVTLRREGTGVALPEKLKQAAAEKPARDDKGRASLSPTTTIRELEIVEGTLRLHSPPPEGVLEVRGIDLAASLEISEGGDRLQTAGDLGLAGLSLDALLPYRETLDALAPKLAFDLDWLGSAGTLDIRAARLVAGPLDLVGRGRLEGMPDAPRLDFVVDPAQVELANLLPLLPPALIPEGRTPRASGPATLAAKVSGPLGDPARPTSYRVDIGFQGAEIGMEGFPLSLSKLTGNVAATDSVLAFNDLSASLGDGSVRVNGTTAGRPDSGRIDMNVVAALDLGLVEKTGFLDEGTTLAGRLDADVRVLSRTGGAPPPALRGVMKLAGGRVTMPTLAVPLQDLQADVAFDGTSANVRDVSGTLGRSAFRGSGEIRNFLGEPHVVLKGHCPFLDVVELIPPPDSAAAAAASEDPGSGRATTAKPPPPLVPELPPFRADLALVVDSLIAPNTQLADATLDARLESGVARLTARVARAHFGEGVDLFDLTGDGVMKEGRLDGSFRSPRAQAFKVPMSAVDGKVAVAERRVDVTDVRAGVFTGSIAGSAIVDMTDPVAPSFEIESRAKEIQANDFLSTLTPARGVLHGTLDLASKFSGKGLDPKTIAQSLVANGQVDARGGKIANAGYTQAIWKALKLDEQAISFRELVAPFSIRGGKLITDNLTLAGTDATWRANGAVAFDGTLDYNVELELSDALANDFRKRAGRDLANLLAGSSGKITLDLAVKGPAAHPSVQLDTSKLAKRAAANVSDQAKRGLDSVRDRLADQ